ncbi:hypothetical protein TNCV_3332731 [Trichonephila clavipes]|nr:hypothetical protein TNCV_3332731 [Trichonephila clavipes]
MRLEELERAEKMRLEEFERAEKMRLEELERAEKMRLEELERAEKMRLVEFTNSSNLIFSELQLKFDLERFKIESGFRVNDESNDSTNACSVTSNLNLKKLIPDFDPKQSNISLYLVIFERQAKRAAIEKKEWVGQLLGLLPLEIVQFIAREPEEQAENYDYVKKLLLKRFKLSPEVFRQKFVQHQKKSDSTWKDFTFEITNYLDEWLIGLEINTFQVLKDLMVVNQLKKRANASMKDHFLDNWANLKSATQIAELFDNYEDVRKVNSKPMDRWGRNDKILTYSGVKEKENRFGKTSPRLGASVPESTRERTFEKRVIQRCYHCNMPGHIKAVCPKLIKNKTTETLNNIEGNENPDFLNSYTTKSSVNGHEIDILRDTGATIDLICAKYINPSSFSGENVWVKQPLSPELVCLPFGGRGNFQKFWNGYNFLPVEILNAVQTRSQVKAAREERGIDSGDAKKGAAKGYARKFNQCSKKNSEEIKSLYEQAASQVQVTNQVYSLEKELLVKNREDKLGNVVKLIVVPEELRDPIKSLCHEGTSAHLGITKSKDKLNRYFYWPNCYRDMERFVKTCDQCQRAGKPNDKKKAPLKLVPVIQEVFTKLNIDACGPLPITSKGNRYAICMSSKFPEAIPVSDISSVSVTDALLNIFSRMGFPREIQCDQGTSFTSAPTTEFFERFGILVRHSSVYHPQSNPVERFHRTLKRLLRVLCLDAGFEWDKHLPSILLALRTVSHESTGYTPSELVYGKNLRTPETF